MDIAFSGKLKFQLGAVLPDRPSNVGGRLSGVRILSGAPFAYKTTDICILNPFAGDGGLRDILTADDPDGLVINFYGVGYRVRTLAS